MLHQTAYLVTSKKDGPPENPDRIFSLYPMLASYPLKSVLASKNLHVGYLTLALLSFFASFFFFVQITQSHENEHSGRGKTRWFEKATERTRGG